ncbi:MAG: hypothetical protein RJB66_2037 [Pseudomonadota bacterium]|jgi:uncharacterized FlaG/YvyC family protein
MQEDVKNQIRLLVKQIERLADESQTNEGYTVKTSRLRLLTEIVKEQTEANEIIRKID